MGIPRKVAKRIELRAAQNEPFVVVPHGGRPSTVWGLDEYLQQRKRAKAVKPWTHRKRVAEDPMGAIAGHVHSSLSRSQIYDEPRPPSKLGSRPKVGVRNEKKRAG